MDGTTELKFDASGRVDPGGSRAVIDLATGRAATLYLPSGRTYGFRLRALDASGNELAYGERPGVLVESAQAMDVDISLSTLIGGAAFRSVPTGVRNGARATLLLDVFPNGRPDLRAPESDWTVTYAVANGSKVLDGNGRSLESQLGITFQAGASGNVTVTATVRGLTGNAPGQVEDTVVTAVIPVSGASAGGIAADLNAPTVTVNAPANPVAGVSLTLTGTASDDREVTRVEVYNGVLKVGEATLAAGAWSLAIVPLAGAQDISVLAYDAAGNVGRANLSFTAGEAGGASGLDPSFATLGRYDLNLGVDTLGVRLALQPDGKVLVAGKAGSDVVLLRLTPEGAPDASFGPAGRRLFDSGGPDTPRGLLVAANGIVLLYDAGTGIRMVRYRSDGTLDAAFGTVTVSSTDAVTLLGAALDGNGRIVVAGAYGSDSTVSRFLPDGLPDTAFNGTGRQQVDFGSGTADFATTVAARSDGSLLVGGQVGPAAGGTKTYLARILANGRLDIDNFPRNGFPTRASDFPGATAVAMKRVLVLPDDSIVVLGEVLVSGGSNLFVERRDANGNLVAGFGSGGRAVVDLAAYDYGNAVAMDASGRILVVANAGSQASAPFGNGKLALARLTATGALDGSFGSGEPGSLAVARINP